MDNDSATIEELEAGIVADEREVRVIRARQMEKHNAAEAKRKLIPVVATSKDQFVMDAKDISGSLRRLPAPVAAEIKKELGGEK